MASIEFPEPQPDDAQEVLSALKSAREAYDQGVVAESVRWLRKAADHAEQAGDDMRALSLARVAADLQADIEPLSAPPPPSHPPPSMTSPAKQPNTPGGNGAGSSQSAVSSPAGGNGQPAVPKTGATADAPALSQALRVSVKRSVRDESLFVARLLEDGDPPEGTQEALIVLLDPDKDLLEKVQ